MSALLARALAKRRWILQQPPREFVSGIARCISRRCRASRLVRRSDFTGDSKTVIVSRNHNTFEFDASMRVPRLRANTQRSSGRPDFIRHLSFVILTWVSWILSWYFAN